MQATSLENAIENFNELQPILFNAEELKNADPSASTEFYHPRPDNPLDEMKVHLIRSRADEKILLTGHIGSGKSTELNRLAEDQQIKEHFFVVKYGVREVLNIVDIDYLDFLISLAAILFTRAFENKIEFSNRTLEKLAGWMAFASEGVGDFFRSEKGKSKIEKTYRFFKRVLSVLMREVLMRDKMRKNIERNITDLLEVINLIIDQIRAGLPGKKQLLVIIDDLEKIPDISRADKLFNQAGAYMIQPHCKIVYTLPIALYYSVKLKPLLNTFGKAYFLRNINLLERKSRKEIRENFDLMRAFLEKRIDLARIDKDAQDMAIRNSGGVVRELMRIAKDAIIKALSKNRPSVALDLVNAVVVELRNEYSRGLLKRHYAVLQAVLENREDEVEDDQSRLELYHARVLLEYENGGRWNAVNPVVAPLIEKFKKGL